MKAGGQEKRRIAIIGLGLIGGSMGLALKAGGLPDIEIVGCDLDYGAASRAEKRGAIDRADRDPARAVAGAFLVVIATPVGAVREMMMEIAPALQPGAIVTDVASTKREVLRWAEETLPECVDFVGGHPMAGKETSGIENAAADLFRDKAYVICPPLNAGEDAVTRVVELARLVGGVPLFLDAAEHDQYAAAVSHLPLVVSTALFTLLHSSPSWNDMASLASSGFRDLTRLASGDPRMSHDICVTNREAIIHWIERLTAELSRYRDLLADARDQNLLEIFTGAKLDRDIFLTKPAGRPIEPAVDTSETRQEIIASLLGGWTRRMSLGQKERPERARDPSGSRAGEPPSEADKPRRRDKS